VLAILSVGVARYIQNSFLGQGLRAVRDSEEAAECSGVPTLRIKLVACTVMGALMGLAGAPMPMYLSHVEPSSTFNLSYSISALAMPIIGGTSHWAGPLIGAVILATLQQVVTVTISSELNVLVVGVLLVLFVVLAPEGVLGLLKKWKTSSK
jgi:branched-chain amino acid transport system permease protein